MGSVVLASLLIALWRLVPSAVASVQVRADSSHAYTPRASTPGVSPLRVLFVGNSHTYYHDMPQMIAQLAAAAQERRGLEVALEVAGGATLAQHLEGGRVRERLSQNRWDYVVLQEQQQRPTWRAAQLEREFYAPARTLDVLIRTASAKTVLFMTAGRQDGDPGNVSGDTYENMQERSRDSHTRLAGELDARLAPIGLAWRWAHQQRPDLPLWAADRYHPSLHGSYLAACVLYSVIYDHSPRDNPYTGGLSAADAQFLQKAADVAQYL